MVALTKSIAGIAVAGALGAAAYAPGDPHLFSRATHPVVVKAHLPPILTREALLGPSSAPQGWRLSGNGQRLAWLVPQQDGVLLTIEDLATGDAITHALPGMPDEMSWGPAARRLFLATDHDGNGHYRVAVLDTAVADAAAVVLMDDPSITLRLEDYRDGDPDRVLISHNQRDTTVLDLYERHLETGQETLVAANPGNVVDWHVARNRGLFARTWRQPDGTLAIDTLHDDGWVTVASLTMEESVEFIGNRVEAGALLALSNRGRNTMALVRFTLADGHEEVLYQPPGLDVEWVWRDGQGNRPLAAHTYAGRVQTHYFDERLRVPMAALIKEYPDAVVSIDDMDRVGQRIVASVYSGGGRAQTWLIDRQAGDRRLLDGVPSSVTGDRHAVPEPFSFTARDGMILHGYITRPPGSENMALPAIVWVHGGPFARSYWGFDPMIQLLANRGYVVIDVNFRGSTGYGKSYMAAARGEFGRKMHTDLIDAVDWAVAQGMVDPDRVAIGGASYGGWAAMVGLARAPDRFVAGVSINGPSDLSSLVSWLAPEPGIWTDYAGDPADPAQRREMRARSPLHNAEQIVDPLLLVHGMDDTRVPVNHSQRMARRLDALGRPVETVWVPGAGHSITDEQQFMIVVRQVETFLAAHLGGRVSAR